MRFELTKGTSNKFWEITRKGKVLHITWGRIGTAGQALNKAFPSDAAAQQEHDSLVASKRKKGYLEVSSGTAKAPSSKAGAPTPPTRAGVRAPGMRAAKSAKAGANKPAAAPSRASITALPPDRPANVPADIPLTRPRRDEGLMQLSGAGQIGPELRDALKYRDRARFVQYAKADKKLLGLTRVTKLEMSGEMPAWIGELRSLRTLIGWAPAKLPASLLTLPHLRYLHVDGSPKLKSLEGVDKLRALETVTFGDTPVGDDEAGLAAFANKIDAQVSSLMPGLDFERAIPKPPKDRKAVIKAINADTLPDRSDLRKLDLSGARFEHAYITHDLRGAKLANTVWVSCDFEYAQLAGADLAGATFYDCYMSDGYGDPGMFGKIKAPGATFIGCGGDLRLESADLRGAQLLDMASDVRLKLAKANGQGMTLQASFVSEKEHQFEVKGADLRGARVFFDVTAGRREELKRKKTARLAWKTDHLKGAKIDKTTQIHYASLDADSLAPATRAAQSTVDPNGPVAPILGRIDAINAGLWLVVADVEVAAHWKGGVADDNPKNDFNRAMQVREGAIKIGDESGVVVDIGDCGWSYIYGPVGDDRPGIRLTYAGVQNATDKTGKDALARRVAQWPVLAKPRRVGSVISPTGVLALLLPYCEGEFSAKLRSKAVNGAVVEHPEGDRALVAMREGPGVYEIARYPFRPERGDDMYEDDLGWYSATVAITYSGRLPAKYARK